MENPNQPPIYTEHFETKKELRVFAMVIGIFIVVSLAYLAQLQGAILRNNAVYVGLILCVALMTFFAYFSERSVVVEYTMDAINVRSRKKNVRIPLQGIEAVWPGLYWTGLGRAFAQTKHPYAKPGSTTQAAEVLVWNIRTSWQTGQQLILKMKSQEKLLVLHTQDRERVLSLLG